MIQRVPEALWREIGPAEHFVQFYEDDSILLDTIDGFIGLGLVAGDGAIVIARQPRLAAIEKRLRARGIDLAEAMTSGQYIPLDANETLSKFIVKGWPDRTLFEATITAAIKRASKNNRRVRAFGEMVAILWEEGNQAATIRLEKLWNDLLKAETFSLFCAYPKHGFTPEGCSRSLVDICREHSRVISTDGAFDKALALS